MTNDPMFDGMNPTQETHLIQHLWDGYVAHLGEEIDRLAKEGKQVLTLEVAKQKAPAVDFVKWAAKYLSQYRAVENVYIEGNLGFRLSNGSYLMLSPGIEGNVRGTMQDSPSIQITEGQEQRGPGTAESGSTMRI